MSPAAPSFAFPPLTPAIKCLLLVNAGVFVVNALLVGRLSQPPTAWFAVSADRLVEGWGLGVLRLVTYQFTHAFESAMHLLWNALTLYFFGGMAEGSLGYRGTWKLYLAGGVAGALAHLLFAWTQGYADVPLVGASGACYAFLVYAAAMAPRSTVILILFPVPLGVLAAVLVFLGAYATYVEFMTGFPGGVAHTAHLGGAALGFAAWRFGWFRDYRGYEPGSGWLAGLRQRWRKNRAVAAAREAERKALRLDTILAKVKDHGIGALTQAERRFLERASSDAKKK